MSGGDINSRTSPNLVGSGILDLLRDELAMDAWDPSRENFTN